MKRILVLLSILALFAGQAYAATSIYKNVVLHGVQTVVVKVSVVANADGTVTEQEVEAGNLEGFSLYKVRIIPGATGPTDNSDLYIYDEFDFDLLGGQGVDAVDNTTDSEVVPSIGGVLAPQPITGTISLDILNNSVNAGACDVYLFFVEGF